MVTVNTTCGHIVHSIDDLFDLQIKGYDDSGKPCIIYGCYCKHCADVHVSTGMIISCKREEEEWMSSSSRTPTDVYSLASDYSRSDDPVLRDFAKMVCKYIESSVSKTAKVSVKIDTDNAFTVSLNDDINITGVGKVEYDSIEDAILALNSAKITWVRPFKAHTPDGLYEVDETDYEHYSFFIQYCQTAALSLLDNGIPYSKIDGPYSLNVQ